jgi:hypothetical protein
VEVGEDIAALNVLGDELELAERSLGVIVVLQIGQRDLKHATFQAFTGNLRTLCTVNQCLADLAGGEHRRRLDIIPVLARERIHNLLLGSLLATLG